MMPFGHLTLLVCIFVACTSAASVSSLEPGVNRAPRIPTDFIEQSLSWNHSTPLLQNSTFNNHTHGTLLPRARASSDGGYYNGWGSIKYIFSFGDSYTSTGFNVSGQQPGLANPLGNPVYPGMTSANGPNYIDFLTTTYNASLIQTYNFGYGGAMIDNSIVMSPFGLIVKSFVDQIRQEFQPIYVGANVYPWAMDNTLFILFFGINDAINTFTRPQNDSLQYAQIQSFENAVDQLYEAGARNFLFLNLPPIDRAPYAVAFSPVEKKSLAAWIERFDTRLDSVVQNLTQRCSDVTAFRFDTYSLFSSVLDDAGQFPETALYKNTTDYCTAYESGTAYLDSFDPACGVPVENYLWLNTLHPTYPMHNFMASQLSKLLAC